MAKKFLIFLSNGFAMLRIFYKQLKSGDSTELSMTLSEFSSYRLPGGRGCF